MACPNYYNEVLQLSLLYPEAFKHCHTGNAHTEDFVRLVAAHLHDLDPNVGLNGKRGNPTDISDDCVNILDPFDGPGHTPSGQKCWVVDFVRNAGISTAEVVWNPINDPVGSTGANVPPNDLPPEPGPVPPSKPTYPTYEALGGDEGAKQITRVLESDYIRAGRSGLDGDCGSWLRRTDYDFMTGICATVEESIAKHRKEWCDALGIPVKR